MRIQTLFRCFELLKSAVSVAVTSGNQTAWEVSRKDKVNCEGCSWQPMISVKLKLGENNLSAEVLFCFFLNQSFPVIFVLNVMCGKWLWVKQQP